MADNQKLEGIVPLEETWRDRANAKLYEALKSLGDPNPMKTAHTLLGGEQSGLPLGIGINDLLPTSLPFVGQETKRAVEKGDYLEAGLNAAGAIPAVKQVVKPAKAVAKSLAPKAEQMAHDALYDFMEKTGGINYAMIGKNAKTWNKKSEDVFLKAYKDAINAGMSPELANQTAWKLSQVKEGKLGEAGTLGTHFMRGHGIAQEVGDEGFKTIGTTPTKGKGLQAEFDKYGMKIYGKTYRDMSTPERAAIKQLILEDYTVKNRMPHTNLEAAYPALSDYRSVIKSSPNESGTFSESSQAIQALGPRREARDLSAIHELQHAVQQIENWPRGANVTRYEKPHYQQKAREAFDARDAVEYAQETQRRAAAEGKSVAQYVTDVNKAFNDQFVGGTPPTLDPRLTAKLNQSDLLATTQSPEELAKEYEVAQNAWLRTPKRPYQAYHATMGEAQARNAENRLRMPNEERLNSFPEATYDINPDRMRFNDFQIESTYQPNVPDIIPKADGGRVHMVLGGASKIAKLKAELKLAKEAEAAAKTKRMSRAEGEALGLYHGIGKNKKLDKPISELEVSTYKDPNYNVRPEKTITPEEMVGGAGIPLTHDLSRIGDVITSVNGEKLINEVPTQGGNKFIREGENPWASLPNVVRRLASQSKEAARLLDTDRIYGVSKTMTPSSIDFSHMPMEVLLNQFDPRDINKDVMKQLNELVRNQQVKNQQTGVVKTPFKGFAGFDTPEGRLQLLGTGNWEGELRKAAMEKMALKDFKDKGLPNVTNSRIATTDPELIDEPLGMTGHSIARLSPFGEIDYAPKKPHWTYSAQLKAPAGVDPYAGSWEIPVKYQDSFPTFFQGRRAKKASPASDDRAFGMSIPIQKYDQEWLEGVKKAQEAIEQQLKLGSYADGGSVTVEGAPAEYMDMPTPTVQDQIDLEAMKLATKPKLVGRGVPYKAPSMTDLTEPLKGLGSMLYGGAKGTISALSGIPGDINELIRDHVPASFTEATGGKRFIPDTVGKMLEKAPAPPTSEAIESKFPTTGRHEEKMGSLLGNTVLSNVLIPIAPKGIAATKGLPVGLSMKDVSQTAPAVEKVEQLLSAKDTAGFYSPIEKAVLNLKRKSGNGQAFLNDILKQPDVHADEMEALKLPEFLGNRTGVTKEELETYIKKNRYQFYPTELNSRMGEADVHYGHGDMTEGGQNYRELLLGPKIDQFGRPRAEPPSIEGLTVKRGANGWGSTDVSLVDPEGREIGYMSRIDRNMPDDRILATWRNREWKLAQDELDQANIFSKGHWGEEHPNTMISTRLQDFGDINGKKGTLIDELQSDWHQLGRKKGYFKPDTSMLKPAPKTTGEFMTVNDFAKRAGIDVNEYVASRNAMQKDIGHPFINAESKLAVLLDDGKPVVARIVERGNGKEVGQGTLDKMVSNRQFAANKIHKDFVQRQAREASVKRQPPDAPYKESWYQVGIKKSIIDAVKKGDDRIYLSTAKTVSDRYALSHQLDSVYIAKNKETGGWFIDGFKDGDSVIQKEVKNDAQLEETVGKDLAKKAMENPDYGQEYKGVDLDVGGKGMEQYYDKNYLNYLKKFAKRYGGEVGETEIVTRPEKWLLRGPNGEKPAYIQAFDDLAKGEAYLAKKRAEIPAFENFNFIHQTPLTQKVYYYEPNDKAKKSILKGLPLKDGGVVHAVGGGGASKLVKQALLKASEGKIGQVADKNLTTLQDFHTSLGDRIAAGVKDMQDKIAAAEFKYKKGDRVFTDWTVKNNYPPYEILGQRILGGKYGMILRDPTTGKALRDEFGKALREPEHVGYHYRHDFIPKGETEAGYTISTIPETSIKGLIDPEEPYKRGGRVHMNQGGTPPATDLDFYSYQMPTMDNSQMYDTGARGYTDRGDYKFGQTKMVRKQADTGVPDVQYARYAEYGEPVFGGRLSGRVTEPNKQAYNASQLADIRYTLPMGKGAANIGVTGVRHQNPYGTNSHIGSVSAGYGMPVDGGNMLFYGSHSPQNNNTMFGVNYNRRFGVGGFVKPISNAAKVASRNTSLPTAPKKITGQGFSDILAKEVESSNIAKQELAKMKQEMDLANLKNQMSGISAAHEATMKGKPIPNFQPRQVSPEEVRSAYEEMMNPQLNLPLAKGGKVIQFKKPEMSLDAMRLKTMFKR